MFVNPNRSKHFFSLFFHTYPALLYCSASSSCRCPASTANHFSAFSSTKFLQSAKWGPWSFSLPLDNPIHQTALLRSGLTIYCALALVSIAHYLKSESIDIANATSAMKLTYTNIKILPVVSSASTKMFNTTWTKHVVRTCCFYWCPVHSQACHI